MLRSEIGLQKGGQKMGHRYGQRLRKNQGLLSQVCRSNYIHLKFGVDARWCKLDHYHGLIIKEVHGKESQK